jgi:hypothetical protein
LDEQQSVTDEDHDMLLVVQIRTAHNQTCKVLVWLSQTGISKFALQL